jgi:hypothetical protein
LALASFFSLAWICPISFSQQLLVALDLGVDVDEVLQIDEDLDARQADGGVGGRRLHVQPPGDGRGVGHRGEIGRHRLQQLLVWSSQRTLNSSGLLGGMFWRLRISRKAPSTAWKRAKRVSISASCRETSATGQAATITLGLAAAGSGKPRSDATRPSSCQTSSVMNGIIGCSSRSRTSSV